MQELDEFGETFATEIAYVNSYQNERVQSKQIKCDTGLIGPSQK